MTRSFDRKAARRRASSHLTPRLLIGYIALLIYGSLFPLSNWREPPSTPWHMIFQHGLHGAYSDMLSNVLVYLPLGLLMARALHARRHPLAAIVFTTLFGACLSLSVEYTQAYLPARVPSILDAVLNATGTFAGALLAFAARDQTRTGRWLVALRTRYFRPGPLADVGLAAVGLWVLSQLTPFVPSLDVGNLRHGLHPLWTTLHYPSLFRASQAAVYALSIAALGVLAASIIHPARRAGALYIGFVIAILLLKVPVVDRQLSLEALVGMVVGLIGSQLLIRLPQRIAQLAAVFSIAGAIIVSEMSRGTGSGLSPFNWIPFREQLSHFLTGFADILSDMWPYFALAYLVRLALPRAARGQGTAVVGALLVFAAVFGLEWYQHYLPGRYGDITDAIVALIAWIIPWAYLARHSEPADRKEPEEIPNPALPPVPFRSRFLLSILVIAGVLAVAGWSLMGPGHQTGLNESLLPKLPKPSELPPVTFAHFHYTHPRLPAPSAADIVALQLRNPGYLKRHERWARNGHGDFYSVILSAYVKPGSQNLRPLFQRLMHLKVQWRGHQQVEPMALAYDWLYDQWTPNQRRALRNKLQDGCDYEVHFIRVERLSPYNVILYNSPFQALMACSIALYGETQKADGTMRFTYDLWKHRVLPVWRQVMGHNGGWHEGNEYVGIGIGKTVYRVPAMWLKATGEDIFKTDPELKGFLDFLIYRTRPDGTNFRWGDGGFFRRAVPARIPLALEYDDAAAYSLKSRPRFKPTSWPWGPLPRPALYDPAAISRLPLTRYFDGIGMLVTRSDWTPNATYVTFKVGDNYWSHEHLDEGAFTIYKGGALAIDSGLYYDYNGDHHMDYGYQTIAHNTITVTDPNDTVPAPARKNHPPRYIANDGGQRRIGSGWGVSSAPLDLNDWKRHYATYHTGTMERVFQGDGFVVAIGDVTPAYTNKYSGEGLFSARTRRVERFTRTFVYDRTSDAIVVFDHVQSTHASFLKRWLLHTIERPTRTADGFSVHIAPENMVGHRGGSLTAHVLLPKQAYVNIIGGRGFQFYVDGKNYDDNGRVFTVLRKRLAGHYHPEPGAWRIEVSPTLEHKTDNFLVVMFPTLGTKAPKASVRYLEFQNKPGCEIHGPQRTSRWVFDPTTGAVHVTIIRDQHIRTYDIQPKSTPVH